MKIKRYKQIIKIQVILLVVLALNHFVRPYNAIGGEFLLLPLYFVVKYIISSLKGIRKELT